MGHYSSFIKMLLISCVQIILSNQNEVDLVSPDIRLVDAVLSGNPARVYDSLVSHANASIILTEEIGVILGLGSAWRNYPLIPVIHIAIGGGSEPYFQIACSLLNGGANPNVYSESYPPAVLYALGYGNTPNEDMASTLQFLFRDEAYFLKFQLEESIEGWNNLKGYLHNPPLLSYAIHKRFLLGAETLVDDAKLNLHHADSFGVSSLHLATWSGQSDMIQMLLSNQVDPFIVDIHGRTILHYLCIRGYESILHLFQSNDKILSQKKFKKLLLKRDNYGFLAHDLAYFIPSQSHSFVTRLNNILIDFGIISQDDEEDYNENDDTKNNRKIKKTAAFSSFTNSYSSKVNNNGWRCDTDSSNSDNNNNNDEGDDDYDALEGRGITDIDIIHYSELSPEKFIQDYQSVQRPVLITGNLTGRQDADSHVLPTSSWSIWKYIQKDSFIERYGKLRVDTGIIPKPHLYGRQEDSQLDVLLSDWIQWMNNSSNNSNSSSHHHNSNNIASSSLTSPTCEDEEDEDEDENDDIDNDKDESSQCKKGDTDGKKASSDSGGGAWIAFEDSIVEQMPEIFLEDVQKPFFATVCDNDPSSLQSKLQLSVGPRSSGSPVHAHGNAWDLLLTGRKKWFLIPPGVLGVKPYSWSGTKHPSNEFTDFENYRKAGKLFEVIQEPGDIMYIPQDWGHAIINLCESVSISQEFCCPKDWDTPANIGRICYGSNLS